MLFRLPMIFMSAMVELTIQTFPDAPKAAPVPLKPERIRRLRDKHHSVPHFKAQSAHATPMGRVSKARDRSGSAIRHSHIEAQ
jgi:hypothetical protein